MLRLDSFSSEFNSENSLRPIYLDIDQKLEWPPTICIEYAAALCSDRE